MREKNRYTRERSIYIDTLTKIILQAKSEQQKEKYFKRN